MWVYVTLSHLDWHICPTWRFLVILLVAFLAHSEHKSLGVCVVVQFYPWFNFYFPLFLCMVMYDNEHKTKESKTWTKDKIEPQHTVCTQQWICQLGLESKFLYVLLNLSSRYVFSSLGKTFRGGGGEMKKKRVVQLFYAATSADFFDLLTFKESSNHNHFCSSIFCMQIFHNGNSKKSYKYRQKWKIHELQYTSSRH